jgi:dienelactone hydrolase
MQHFNRPLRIAIQCACVLIGTASPASAQKKPPSTQYFEQEVPASNPLRAEQAKELDSYILQMKRTDDRLREVFKPDYSSPAAFEKSAGPLRKAFCDSIGYPPPGAVSTEEPKFEQMGEDTIATYYRATIPILPQVHAEGIYIVPKGLTGKAPLIISMHGGGGSPEVALFHGGANYHDMVRGGVKRGYIVFAPQHLFSAPGYPRDVRNKTDERLRLVGTSLTAIEIAKITRSLDVILKRPEVDPTRVGMVGLSYGGYYALVTPAIDTRIKVSVSSCYYGVQEGRYERDELSVPSDFKFKDRFTLFKDSDIVALICPRALEIQAGSADDEDHREPGKRLAPLSAEYYSKLDLKDRFRHLVFNGKHEFHDESAWEFVSKHL